MTTEFELKISDIVASMNQTTDASGNPVTFSYVFASKNEANYLLEKTTMPCVVNILPVSGKLEVKATSINDSPNCLLGFFDKLPEVNAVIDDIKNINSRMMLAAQEFIAKVNSSGKFKTVENVSYQNIEEYDIACFGYVLQLQLTEMSGTAICNLK